MHTTAIVIRHRIPLMEVDRCINFQVASSKYLEIRGHPACTCVARAQCTTTHKVMHQRIALVELYQCTKFRVASSKFPESESAYAYAKCTCCTRALCTPSRNGMYHRITLIELHQCTKFGVDISKFPTTGGPPRENMSGPGARSLHPTTTITTKAHTSRQYAFNQQVWLRR